MFLLHLGSVFISVASVTTGIHVNHSYQNLGALLSQPNPFLEPEELAPPLASPWRSGPALVGDLALYLEELVFFPYMRTDSMTCSQESWLCPLTGAGGFSGGSY